MRIIFTIFLSLVFISSFADEINPMELKDILRETTKIRREIAEMKSAFEIEKSRHEEKIADLDESIRNLKNAIENEEKRIAEEKKSLTDIQEKLEKSKNAEEFLKKNIVYKCNDEFTLPKLSFFENIFKKQEYWKNISEKVEYTELARLFIRHKEKLLDISNEVNIENIDGKKCVRVGLSQVLSKDNTENFDKICDMIERKKPYEIIEVSFLVGGLIK